MKSKLLEHFQQARVAGRKQLAVLIDPDKADQAHLQQLVRSAERAGADYFFIGGSLLSKDALGITLQRVKALTELPVLIFPGGATQVSPHADGILLLSLISGRNPEYLIGSHVVAAPLIKAAGLCVLPTAYVLIDGGAPTTVSYISNTQPIPANKPDIAACTALAGEQLGLQLLYLDAGSGAPNQVPATIISAVRGAVDLPVIVGGGIRTTEEALGAWRAGADVVVVGNALEENTDFMEGLATAMREAVRF
jgi:phosphoglycerol geranylgeranyltransferase